MKKEAEPAGVLNYEPHELPSLNFKVGVVDMNPVGWMPGSDQVDFYAPNK